MSATAAIATGLFGVAKEWLSGRQEKQQAKKEITKAKAEAAMTAYKNHQEDAAEWEKLALENSGWKDEYWTIALSIPAILCFISMDFWGVTLDGPAVVTAGFEALSQTPEWFKVLFQVAVYSAFGYKYGGKTAGKASNAIIKRMEGKK